MADEEDQQQQTPPPAEGETQGQNQGEGQDTQQPPENEREQALFDASAREEAKHTVFRQALEDLPEGTNPAGAIMTSTGNGEYKAEVYATKEEFQQALEAQAAKPPEQLQQEGILGGQIVGFDQYGVATGYSFSNSPEEFHDQVTKLSTNQTTIEALEYEQSQSEDGKPKTFMDRFQENMQTMNMGDGLLTMIVSAVMAWWQEKEEGQELQQVTQAEMDKTMDAIAEKKADVDRVLTAEERGNVDEFIKQVNNFHEGDENNIPDDVAKSLAKDGVAIYQNDTTGRVEETVAINKDGSLNQAAIKEVADKMKDLGVKPDTLAPDEEEFAAQRYIVSQEYHERMNSDRER